MVCMVCTKNGLAHQFDLCNRNNCEIKYQVVVYNNYCSIMHIFINLIHTQD